MILKLVSKSIQVLLLIKTITILLKLLTTSLHLCKENLIINFLNNVNLKFLLKLAISGNIFNKKYVVIIWSRLNIKKLLWMFFVHNTKFVYTRKVMDKYLIKLVFLSLCLWNRERESLLRMKFNSKTLASGAASIYWDFRITIQEQLFYFSLNAVLQCNTPLENIFYFKTEKGISH